MTADIFSPEKRSQVMSLIKGKGTKAELITFRFLREKKVHFQKHYTRAPAGTPDIARPRDKKAVFIDGSFWHGFDYDKRKDKLSDYWRARVERNMARDFEQERVLAAAGWHVLRVWEHDIVRISTRTASLDEIRQFLMT